MIMVMVRESLQHGYAMSLQMMKTRLCVCVWVFVLRDCQWIPQFLENQILVGCIDFGTNIYVLL